MVIYFIPLILLGAFFVINLFLAVIFDSFYAAQAEQQLEQASAAAHAWPRPCRPSSAPRAARGRPMPPRPRACPRLHAPCLSSNHRRK